VDASSEGRNRSMKSMEQPIFQDLSLFRVPRDFRGRSAWVVQLWWLVQDTLFRMSPQVLFGWRCFLLRLFGAQVGSNVKFRSTARITYPWKLSIGDNVWVGDDCVLYNLGQITLGSNVALAHGVYLCTGLHDFTRLEFPMYTKPIVIEDEVWLTNDVFVAPGVTVGRGSVVGARSSVFGNLPGGMICFGTPALARKPRFGARGGPAMSDEECESAVSW
jgi:putative colanic acid biosynthesis acetyltransferase WcaF